MREPGRIYTPPKWIGTVIGLAFVVSILAGLGLVAWEFGRRAGMAEPLTKPARDVVLVSGEYKDFVFVYHDNRRSMTCYVTAGGGIWCAEDIIIIEDQLRMLAYRDAGSP